MNNATGAGETTFYGATLSPAALVEGVFFFKQKTAYELVPCDWSSDVCSSDLASRADETRHPAQQRVALAPLRRDVDALGREGATHDRPDGVRRAGEPRAGARLPLHRGAHAHPALEVEVLPHADLVAVQHDRRGREREHQRPRHAQ